MKLNDGCALRRVTPFTVHIYFIFSSRKWQNEEHLTWITRRLSAFQIHVFIIGWFIGEMPLKHYRFNCVLCKTTNVPCPYLWILPAHQVPDVYTTCADGEYSHTIDTMHTVSSCVHDTNHKNVTQEDASIKSTRRQPWTEPIVQNADVLQSHIRASITQSLLSLLLGRIDSWVTEPTEQKKKGRQRDNNCTSASGTPPKSLRHQLYISDGARTLHAIYLNIVYFLIS